MKKLFALTILMMFNVLVSAQDTIILKNGEKRLATIVNVDRTNIQYREFPDKDGYIRLYEKDEVAALRYDKARTELPKAYDRMSVHTEEFMPPSYYLNRSANCQWGMIGASVGAGFFYAFGAVIQFNNPKDVTTPLILYGTSIACGITAFVLQLMSISNLYKAGKALERVHIIQNGVSIDL